jgi:hypothetical protein
MGQVLIERSAAPGFAVAIDEFEMALKITIRGKTIAFFLQPRELGGALAVRVLETIKLLGLE